MVAREGCQDGALRCAVGWAEVSQYGESSMRSPLRHGSDSLARSSNGNKSLNLTPAAVKSEIVTFPVTVAA